MARKWQYLSDVILATAVPVVAYFLMRSLLAKLEFGGLSRDRDRAKVDAVARKLNQLLECQQAALEDAEDSDDDENDNDDDEFNNEKGGFGLDYGSGCAAKLLESTSGRRRKERPKTTKALELTPYEQTIAMEIVMPSEIPVSFSDIGGLDNIIRELRETVIYPLTLPQLFASRSGLLGAPSGVLLHGPPGCGKTMLAKALAHESGATFINLHISTLTEKWYGDSNKLVSAVFSLARKLAPSVIFIDEIDALLGTRRSGENEANGMVKAEFMTHWDGLASVDEAGKAHRVCILGATNRINDIDEAILRRMPRKFYVPFPADQQRRSLLRVILRDTKLDEDKVDLDIIVKMTDGMSASDIKNMCREAVMNPIRVALRSVLDENTMAYSPRAIKRLLSMKKIRDVKTEDFFVAYFAAARDKGAAQSLITNLMGDPSIIGLDLTVE